MMFHTLMVLTLFIVEINCLWNPVNMNDYRISHITDGYTSKRIVHAKYPSDGPWIARSMYNKTYLTKGWDTFDIETNPEIEDETKAFVAGYLEGVETHRAILDHYYNIVHSACLNEMELCAQIDEFLSKNIQWIQKMADTHAESDIYWQQVKLFYFQMSGITIGYNSVASKEEQLTHRDIMWMNFIWDIDELKSAMKNETNRNVKGNSHCSALIKIVHGQSDVLVSHNTWTGYETMRRIVKRYTMTYKNVASSSISFPGYPAALVSGDDFYILNSGLVTQETTNGNNNATLWKLVQPIGQVLEVVRVTVANRLGDSGRSWSKIFSEYNSGTYNNQWMIVDMKKFSPGQIKPELLWVVEQIPGYIRREDQTELLLSQGYWASYNRPFYPDIFNMSGNVPLVRQFGDFFTYEKTPRALIFKRDQYKVVDIHTMMRLMRSNDFRHDPLSRCNCTPPFSAENAIASRNDLNPANGTYPFHALSHRSSGATDAKVTNYQLSRSLSFLAVSGPTTGAHLPPFQWSKTDFDHKLSHRGHPDLFQFTPVLISWTNQQR